MRYEKATLKDIAKTLNLSVSTVSRALRDSYEISDGTKKMVLDYAKKINFQPNPVALSLKERRSYVLGVLVSEVANTFFSEAINGMESIAYKRGYRVIITQNHESEEREKTTILHYASSAVDGLLMSLSSTTVDLSYLKDLYEKGFPIVFFDRVADEIETHKVTANNYLGAFQATEHLISQGFQRIAHITSSPYLSITTERLNGYKAALEKYHIPFDEYLVKNCQHGGMIAEEVKKSVTELFQPPGKPDAVFTASDRITTVCFGELKKLKLKRKIGFVGFSNTKEGELFCPTLTVVQQPAFEIGQTSAEMLIQMIENKARPQKFEKKIIDTRLIIRESSKKTYT